MTLTNRILSASKLNSQFTLFLERHAMLLSSFYASILKVFAARADFITPVLWVPIVTLPSFRRKRNPGSVGVARHWF